MGDNIGPEHFYKDKCYLCNKHPIMYKDYRFIDSCGFQGKVFSCEWCRSLSDKAISEMVRDELDPKEMMKVMIK